MCMSGISISPYVHVFDVWNGRWDYVWWGDVLCSPRETEHVLLWRPDWAFGAEILVYIVRAMERLYGFMTTNRGSRYVTWSTFVDFCFIQKCDFPRRCSSRPGKTATPFLGPSALRISLDRYSQTQTHEPNELYKYAIVQKKKHLKRRQTINLNTINKAIHLHVRVFLVVN